MRRMTTLLCLVFLISCTPINNVFFINYVVPKHKHYSFPRASLVIPNDIVRWKFKTNDTWPMDQSNSGISKIGGVYWQGVHKTSVRLGYQDWDNEQWIWYYIYENSVSPQQETRLKGKICKVEIPRTYDAVTGWQDGYFVIEINDTIIKLKTDFVPKWPTIFTANYIGGTYTISHKWSVPIKLNR